MFRQVPPAVCWSSYAYPSTLVNIGTDAVALLCQNIVIFHDVRTKAIAYYTADNTENGAGISCLAGHHNYPIFAFAETVLRPSIHVFKYPEMKRLIKIPPTTAMGFIDIFLMENCYLLAITDGADHASKLHLWNYRTGVHCAEADTQKCTNHCLCVRPSIEPSIILYSSWSREISAWEISVASDKHSFHEVSTAKLGDEYKKSDLFAIAFVEDPYIVNDFGVVSSLNFGREPFKAEWIAPQKYNQPKAWMLFGHKSGLIVVNATTVYYIKKRQHEMVLEWHLNEIHRPISKIVSNFNSEVYACTHHGNIYSIDGNQDGVILQEILTRNCHVLDYCLIKGSREEVILILTAGGELRLVEIDRMQTLSSFNCFNACCIGSHNLTEFVAVGTTCGKIHFISYENSREPIELGVVHVDEPLSIKQVQIYGNVALVTDRLNGIYIVHCDYEAKSFKLGMSLKRDNKEERNVIKVFLLDAQYATQFVSESGKQPRRFAKYLWLFSWQSDELMVKRREFQLPYTYKDVTLLHPYTREKILFVAVRNDDLNIDELVLEKDEMISISSTTRTSHLGYIDSISGSYDLTTSSTQSVICHFRSHELGKIPYSISRPLLSTFVSRLRIRTESCFGLKYLLVLYADGNLLAFRLPPLTDSLTENKRFEHSSEMKETNYTDYQEELRSQTIITLPDVNEKDLEEQQNVMEELKSIRKATCELIDYDIMVTGHSHGIYRKFCLNTDWHTKLVENAQILCKKERAQLLEAVSDQMRIKNWILELIGSSKNKFSFKIRSIFSNIYLENYGMQPILNEILNKFDHFRFYDMDLCDDDNGFDSIDADRIDDAVDLEHDRSVLEHVMSKEFELQDTLNVSFNQMYNEDAKLQVLLIDALKQEFNYEFNEMKNFKQQFIKDISKTNALLATVYININCMLSLLNMDRLMPPELEVPKCVKDEDLEQIMTVDDSEIYAPNPHKKLMLESAHKTGRMLLWPFEYWMRAIMYMMDGVLEKLWEEEIKKTPALPEFTKNKEPSEFSMEEQKEIKEYEQRLVLLEEDRRKYLRILKENETKTLSRKKFIIMKLNERISQIAILKLNYDFAVKHEQLRLQNLKIINFKRIQCKNRINQQKYRIERDLEYINRYTQLIDDWERTFADLKSKLENQTHRDKQLERQFKGQYLSSVPAHLTFELNKIYKRRPKLSAKAFNNSSLCYEVADRLMSKKHHQFPIPLELQEFVALLDSLDDLQYCPHQLDHKCWENFIKIRRQKLESELRLKAIGYQLLDAQNSMNSFTKDSNIMKASYSELTNSMAESIQEYFEIIQNRNLELVLPLGRVEVNVQNLLANYDSYMLLNINDIEEVNDMIRRAGKKKIKAMHRVAFFRRQVIYKEWEHKVVKANIEYLQYVLKLIHNCKISYEFLEILRNWEKVKENKFVSNAIGSLQKKTRQKIESSNERLKRIETKTEIVRRNLHDLRKSNMTINRQILELQVNIDKLNFNRDVLREEKNVRDRNERFLKLKAQRNLIDNVRHDYVHILELTTILELQRLRTYPTLGPPPQCTHPD